MISISRISLSLNSGRRGRVEVNESVTLLIITDANMYYEGKEQAAMREHHGRRKFKMVEPCGPVESVRGNV